MEREACAYRRTSPAHLTTSEELGNAQQRARGTSRSGQSQALPPNAADFSFQNSPQKLLLRARTSSELKSTDRW